MIKILLLYSLYLVLSFPVRGQHMPANMMNAGAGTNITDHMLIMDSRKAMNPSDVVIDGTPYLSPDFAPASVRAKRGAFDAIPARYNACDDNLEYQLQGVTYMVNPSPNIMKVQFNDYALVVDKLVSREGSYAFFIRLDSGRATLLTRKPIEFKAAQEPKAIETEGKPARYVSKQQEYFIKIGEEAPKQFNNARKLVELLPDHQKEIEAFVSSNKISKKPEDLAKLVAYYNSL